MQTSQPSPQPILPQQPQPQVQTQFLAQPQPTVGYNVNPPTPVCKSQHFVQPRV